MRAEGRVVAVTYGRDLFPPTVTIELEQGTENPWKLGDEAEVLRANSAEAEWQYQKQDTLARGAVVDFTDTLPVCAVCGAAAYFHAYPDGYGGALFAVRWRCGHEPKEDEDENDTEDARDDALYRAIRGYLVMEGAAEKRAHRLALRTAQLVMVMAVSDG